MERTSPEDRADFKSWAIIGALVLLFLAWGLFVFFAVGDKGPPPWDFGVAQDIPGESSYSTERPFRGKVSDPQPQHVLERPASGLEK